MPQDNSLVAKSIYDLFNSRDFTKIKSLISEQADWSDIAAGAKYQGQQCFQHYAQNWLTALPDGKVAIQNVINAGDFVVIELLGSGTHTGSFKSPSGEIPATGKKVQMNVCDVLQFRDGQLIGAHTYYDVATLLRQIGVMTKLKAA